MNEPRTLPTWIAKTVKDQGNQLTALFALLSLVGFMALVIGELGPAGSGANGFLVAGGTLLGAGLAAVFAIIASRYAVLEGYRKDANLRRKDDLYGPLQGELTYVRDRLEEARE